MFLDNCSGLETHRASHALCSSCGKNALLWNAFLTIARSAGFDIVHEGESALDEARGRKQKRAFADAFCFWRGGRDSNPRPSYPGTHLAGEPIQPLWHLPGRSEE